MTKNILQPAAEFDSPRILERPNGFYWQDRETGEEFGPFASLAEATEDMEFNAEAEPEDRESPEEAERDLGISDWIDPDTGLPAEEAVPRIEDH